MTSLLLLLALHAPAAEPVVAADLIYWNAKVWTGDPARPQAEAIAVWRDRILKVGANEEVKSLAGPKTWLIDLQGMRVVPGFYDSHLHFLSGGLSLSRVDLKDAAN